MIQETDTMDRIVRKPGISRRTKIVFGAAIGLLLSAGLLWPSVRRWSQAEESVDLARLRVATVTRGDLQREVSAQGRVVAANHPRLFSPAQGIVSLAVKAGAEGWGPRWARRCAGRGCRRRLRRGTCEERPSPICTLPLDQPFAIE